MGSLHNKVARGGQGGISSLLVLRYVFLLPLLPKLSLNIQSISYGIVLAYLLFPYFIAAGNGRRRCSVWWHFISTVKLLIVPGRSYTPCNLRIHRAFLRYLPSDVVFPLSCSKYSAIVGTKNVCLLCSIMCQHLLMS